MFVCVCVCVCVKHTYKRCIHVVSLLHNKVEWCSSVMNPRAILRITANRFSRKQTVPWSLVHNNVPLQKHSAAN